MTVRTLVEAVNDSLHHELDRDHRVMVLGTDVGRIGGVFRATVGLRDRFGPDRCVDAPLAEAGMVGAAVGLCLAGWRPVCEIQFESFSYPALDQLVTHVGRYRQRTRGRTSLPLTVRMPVGGGVRAPELHQDSPEAFFAHAPGLKVVIPSTPADAKGLLAAAIRDPDPVIVLEPKRAYRSERGEVPDGEHLVQLGTSRTVRSGDDLTILCYGSMVPACERAADKSGYECEILDVRSLVPLDVDAVIRAASKTRRVLVVHEAPRTAGFGAELVARVTERVLLDAPAVRVTGQDVPYPFWGAEDFYVPSVERVTQAILQLAAT